jgi:hypothetical protein
MDKLITELEESAAWYRQISFDVGGDYGYADEKNGNVDTKVDLIQDQIDLLISIVKELKSNISGSTEGTE